MINEAKFPYAYTLKVSTKVKVYACLCAKIFAIIGILDVGSQISKKPRGGHFYYATAPRTYGLPLLGDPLVERRVGLQERPQLQQRHLVLQVRLVEWLRPENQMQD